MESFIDHYNVIRHSNAVAAGTSQIAPAAGVSCKSANGIAFLVEMGAITAGAVTSAKLQQSSEVDGATDTFADIAGSSVTIADTDDNKVIVLELAHPAKEFIRCVVSRATQNATVEGITAILIGAQVRPPTRGATMGSTVRRLVNAGAGTP
jgi:hypothetical protein